MNAKWGISGDAKLVGTFIQLGIWQARLERSDRVNPFYLLEEHANSSEYASRNFLWFEGKHWTYKEVYDHVLQYAHWLKQTHQVATRDIVAVDCMNHPKFVLITFAIWSLGAKPAYINYNLGGEGLMHCIRASNARVVLVDDAVVDKFTPEVREKLSKADFRKDAKGNVELSLLDAALHNKTTTLSPHREPDTARSGAGYNEGKDTMGALIFTSGTTGLPKPAIVSWGKLTGSGPLMHRWGELRKTDTYYTCMPLYHSTAMVLALMACQYSGACCAIGHKFSNSTFWPEVRASNATLIQYVGETNRYLLAAPPQLDPVTGENLDKKHSVHSAFGNGMRPDVWDRFKERFGIDTVGEFYSATESPQSSWNLSRNTFTSGAIGRAGKVASALFGGCYRIVEVDIDTEEPRRDPANNNFVIEVPPSHPGELIFKLDPDNIKFNYQGYYGNENASNKKILRDCFVAGDAYYRTGDILRIDEEGRQYFMDRIGDTFRWRSENVSTNEVSEALGHHAAINEANVYGVEVPHHDGRAGCAAITFNVPVTAELMRGLAEFALKKLPKYAVPVFVRVTQDQMVTGNNKQQKSIFRNQGVDLAKLPGEDEMFYFNGREYAPFGEGEWERLKAGQMKL